MRDNIWYSLVDAKFRAILFDECSRLANLTGQGYTIFLAIIASTSVAAWAVWSKYPVIWAVIVAISQVLHVIKPHVPFLKQGGVYRDMSNTFDSLYLQYEKLWYKLEQGSMEYIKAEKDFYNLREEELEIERRYAVHPPRFQWIIRKSKKELDNTLCRFFKGKNHV
jgi:hypothetical protein